MESRRACVPLAFSRPTSWPSQLAVPAHGELPIGASPQARLGLQGGEEAQELSVKGSRAHMDSSSWGCQERSSFQAI